MQEKWVCNIRANFFNSIGKTISCHCRQNYLLTTRLCTYVKKSNRVCYDKSSQGVDAIEAGETMMGRKLRKHLCFLELMEQPSYSWLIAGNSNIDQKTNQYLCIQRLIGQYNLVACCVYLGNTKRNKAKDVWPLLLGFLISFKSNMLMCSPCGFSKCARRFNSLQNMFQISRPCLDKNPINFPIETFLRKEKINLNTWFKIFTDLYRIASLMG